MSAPSPATPPALPPEVRAAITLVALKQFEGGMRMGTVAELAKRNADEYCAALAAVLAPLLRERDDLRAEVLRLQGIASTNADQLAETVRERGQLRAQLADARQAVAAAQEDKERMADLLAASLRYIPAGAPYGDFATMTKGEGSLILQVGFAIATARGTNLDAARREGGAK